MSEKKENGKKDSSGPRLLLTFVGLAVAVVVVLLGLSFGGDGGGLVYVDEARDEQCQLFRGAGVLSAEDEDAVRSGSEGISAKEADSADGVEVSGLPSGKGSPVYIVRQFGEADVVIKSGVCFFGSVESAVNAIDNPAELKTATSTREASPEGVPVGEVSPGDSGSAVAGGKAGGEQSSGLTLTPGDVREAVAQEEEYYSIFDQPRTAPGLYLAGVVLIGLLVAGLWVMRLAVERDKFTDTLNLEGTLDGKGRAPKDVVDKVPGEYTVVCSITVRNSSASDPSTYILRRVASLRKVWELALPTVRTVVSSYGEARLLSEYKDMEDDELEGKVEAALRKLAGEQKVEFDVVLSNAELESTAQAWLNRMRNIGQYADEYREFCKQTDMQMGDFNSVLAFLGRSLGPIGDSLPVFADAFTEYVHARSKEMEREGGK